MEKIQWTSENGVSVTLLDTPPLILERLNGNDVSGNAQAVRAPGQDGETVYNITRSARTVNIVGHIWTTGSHLKTVEAAVEEQKNYLCYTFDPKYFGTLIYTTDAGAKMLRCRPVALPVFGKPHHGLTSFDIDLRSERWDWVDAKEISASIGKVQPNWFFPYFVWGSPLAFVYATMTLRNDTPYELSPVVTVYNCDTAVEVANQTTGQTLRFNHAVGADEKLIVDTENATAILYEMQDDVWVFKANVLNWLTLDSDITAFKVAPGDNSFIITKQTSTSEPVLTVSFHKPLAGVY
ncbi:MAG: hypothetical protein AB9835_04905 [Eubacteriales bacterium]